MILTISLELPLHVETPWYDDSINITDSEVRDPAVGVIGHAIGQARVNWRDGRRYLEVTIEVDDARAVDAAQRGSPIF